MRRDWQMRLPGGGLCRWSAEGGPRLHEFFHAVVLGVGLTANEQGACVPPECRVIGLGQKEWDALDFTPAPRLEYVLKVDWHEDFGCVNYLNLDRLPSGIALMLLRRMLVLHALMRSWLAGETVQFHGALLRNGNTGLVIAGRSGTGKSTSAKKVRPPWECLCDDCMLLARRADGYWARPMPTWSAFVADDQEVRPLKSVEPIRVRMLVYLEQSVTDEFFAVTPGEAVLGAVPAVIDLFQVCSYAILRETRLEAKRQGFEFAATLAHSIPVRRMAHTLEGRPWESLAWGNLEQ